MTHCHMVILLYCEFYIVLGMYEELVPCISYIQYHLGPSFGFNSLWHGVNKMLETLLRDFCPY